MKKISHRTGNCMIAKLQVYSCIQFHVDMREIENAVVKSVFYLMYQNYAHFMSIASAKAIYRIYCIYSCIAGNERIIRM